MSAPQTQLDPSAVIGQAFATYKAHAGVLIPAALGVFALQAIIALLVADNAAGALVLGITSIALSTIYTGAVVQLVRDVQDGRLDSTPGQIVSSVLPVIVPLFLVSLLAGILIGIGFVLILVPGLFLMTIFSVVGPVTVIERPGIFAALGRSRELVKGSGWPVFGVILFVIALSIVASIITAIIGVPLGSAGRAVVQWLSSSILAPVGALATATVYLTLREVRGEAPISSAITDAPPAPGI